MDAPGMALSVLQVVILPIALYGETHKVKETDIGTDGIVARQNYDTLTNRLTVAGATFSAKLTRHPPCRNGAS